MNGVQLFNVAPAIPSELAFLETLAYNMWWCWNLDAIELFRRMDPRVWKEQNHNPLRFLNSISQKKLESLVVDEGFMAHYDQVRNRFDAEVSTPAGDHGDDCIAYFSLEYGIHESLRLYSGGLGVLAGDHLKAASDMNLPLVGVGLMYRCGYFQQYLNDDGWQQEAYPENEIHRMPLKHALGADGHPVEIEIQLPDETMKAIVWKLQVGRIPLYLLDTNIPSNPQHLREITFQLYQGDRTTRLRQELLLGIGGFRALQALGHDPSACHINEGHAAFMSLARISHLVKDKGVDVGAAQEIVRRTNIFTTHTPVPAGNETFAVDLVRPHLDALEGSLGISADQVLAWGRGADEDANAPLSMTVLGLRMAEFCNGVSKLHGKVAREMWAYLWPGYPDDELPIKSITNGTHVSSWLSAGNTALYDRCLGPEWRDNPSSKNVLERISQMPDEDLWRVHEINRSQLIRVVRELGEKQYKARNATNAQLAEIRSVLSYDSLTVGFARRFASYKRATLLFKDPDRLEALLNDQDKPIQFVFAGKAHSADNYAKELIKEIIHFAKRTGLRKKIIFLEDYDIRIARYMVQGVDVWLNTPRRPQEASGTSGMKAAINGALHLSVLDGWWDEGYTRDNGWAIGNRETFENVEYQDSVESQALYNLLENDVIPRFYDRLDGGIPERWTKMMKESIRDAFAYFTSHRMLTEYNEQFYKPAISEYHSLNKNGAARPMELAKQHVRLQSLWSGVKVSEIDTDKDMSNLHVGDVITVAVIVNLGKLTPEEVDIQVYYGPVSAENKIVESNAEVMVQANNVENGELRYTYALTCEYTGRYGFTARAVPHGTEWQRVIPGFVTWAEDGN